MVVRGGGWNTEGLEGRPAVGRAFRHNYMVKKKHFLLFCIFFEFVTQVTGFITPYIVKGALRPMNDRNNKCAESAKRLNNMKDTGKIGRLPEEVREQLNGRLENGEESPGLVDWVNGLPTVQSVVAAEDMAEWMEGGYRDWVAQRRALQETQGLAVAVSALQGGGGQGLTGTLAQFLAAQYAVAARAMVRDAAGKPVELERLRALCRDVAQLQRGDQNSERLGLDRQRVGIERLRLELAERESETRWKKRTVLGLEALQSRVTEQPEVAEAFEAFAKLVRGTFDNLDLGAKTKSTQKP